jgi:predicted TIM-barrel enzyme
MPFIERTSLLSRFHKMIRNGEPIIGGGAGT